jgi:hypothetical protein
VVVDHSCDLVIHRLRICQWADSPQIAFRELGGRFPGNQCSTGTFGNSWIVCWPGMNRTTIG